MDIPYKTVGEYKHYNHCRFCTSQKLYPVIDLGYLPLAGGFLKKDTAEAFAKEKVYPLQLSFCPNCFLLQSVNVIDKNTLFKNYYYFSSAIKTLNSYFRQSAQELKNSFKDPKRTFVVEIGCNDGKLLKELMGVGFKTLGVDPAINIVNSVKNNKLRIINDFFTEKLAKKIVKSHGRADSILSFNTLAHIEDMHDVAKGIKHLLKKDGFLGFGVHYLGNLIRQTQYDMIYHEHQYYYSLITLQNFFAMHDMEIYDLKQIPIHAGSIIFFVQNKKYGKREISKRVIDLKKKELNWEFDKIKTYRRFMRSIKKTKIELLALITKIKLRNKSIAGYGASGRGTVIMNYCGLTNKFIDYVVDDAPAKRNAFTPGTHFKIYSSSFLDKKNRPDYTLLFAWSFFNEIKKRHPAYLKNGGAYIIPLPKIRLINKAF